MPFSIELFLDPKSSMAVQQCGEALENIKAPTIFSTLGASPHVSLAVFEQYNPERLHGLLKKLASSFSPIPFHIGSLGTFAGKEGVLFLAPVATPALLEIHGTLHRSLPQAADGLWAYYDPGQWVAHCTLAMKLTRKKLSRGFELLSRKGFSVRGRFTHLALVETQFPRLRSVRQIYSISFSGKKG